MNEYYFTFRSITLAQQALDVLTKNGISAILLRSPKRVSKAGCGFAVRVNAQSAMYAKKTLERYNIRFENMISPDLSGW